ncbi:MAG: hypothetical protein FWC41_10515 [Firmicutes bacterium]|nr:hypothetical protein [Bacillota bacterium]MCL2312897.1 hypothetical protein [Bacillota bacterium]
MKKLLFLFALGLLFLALQAQTQTFIYSIEGEPVLLERNDTVQYIHFIPNADTKGMEDVSKEKILYEIPTNKQKNLFLQRIKTKAFYPCSLEQI